MASDVHPAPPPPALQRLFDEASAALSRGDWPRAAAAVEQLHRQVPGSAQVAVLGAHAMGGLGRYRDARAFALEAAQAPIDDPATLVQAVRTLRRFEEPEALQRLVSASRWRGARAAPQVVELALHLGSGGSYPLALECLEHALALAPMDANAHYLKGLFEMFSGRTEASVAALRRAVGLRRGMANAHWLLAMQGEADTAEAHVRELRAELAAARPGSMEEVYLCYSLHQRLDALGLYADAWQALDRGNRGMRRATPYDREQQHALFADLAAMPPPSPDLRLATPAGGAGLVFIVGMFRSGTTLVERVLAGHADVVDGGETYQFSAAMREATDHDCGDVVDRTIVARAPAADFGRVRARMQAYADWRTGGNGMLTEKLPSNFLNLGWILHALPEARIVHMRRDPVQTCFSNLRTIFSGAAPYACDQDDLADYYLQYQSLMAHWHALAPGKILDVDYATFVADPAAGARRLMAHCGLDYQPGALSVGRSGGMAATASAAHVRKGILGNRGEAWKPYAAQLGPMLRGLGAA